MIVKGRENKAKFLTITFLCVSVLLLGLTAMAKDRDEDKNDDNGKDHKKYLLISTVQVNFDEGVIHIYGANFDNGEEPYLLLGSDQVLTVLTYTPTTIQAVLPQDIPAGDYLLTVTTKPDKKPKKNYHTSKYLDKYNLTIGAVGPQGPQGDQGPQGPNGPEGIHCWDLNRNRVCDDAAEDKNSDGSCTIADCQGPQGLQGPAGLSGLACWDLNGNRACDLPTEDADASGTCTTEDCQGGYALLVAFCDLCVELDKTPYPLICLNCGNNRIEPLEQCDDGNLVGGDSCSAQCQSEICGDGKEDVGEQCDDGNTVNEDGCSAQCLLEVCGDGILLTSRGEQCDDGNTANGDGCDANCILEVCGNGVVQYGEACDDGNTNDGDACSGDCSIDYLAIDDDGDGVSVGAGDCDDSDANVFRGQGNYFSVPRPNGSWDYNCDHRIDQNRYSYNVSQGYCYSYKRNWITRGECRVRSNSYTRSLYGCGTHTFSRQAGCTADAKYPDCTTAYSNVSVTVSCK